MTEAALRQKSNFQNAIKLESTVQSLAQKYLVSPVGQIIFMNSRRPASSEGRIAIVTNVERGMRWTLTARLDERADAADGEVAWA